MRDREGNIRAIKLAFISSIVHFVFVLANAFGAIRVEMRVEDVRTVQRATATRVSDVVMRARTSVFLIEVGEGIVSAVTNAFVSNLMNPGLQTH